MTAQASDDTIISRSLTYTVVPLDTVLDIANGFRQAGRRWHSHVLSPDCAHNPYAGQFAIVIEDDKGQASIAVSTVFPEADRALVKMLHGDTITDRASSSAVTGATTSRASALPGRIAEIDRHRLAWHHHMHFPGCALSPRPSRWTVAVESDDGDFFETFDGEPIDVLRELEVLYFAHMDTD